MRRIGNLLPFAGSALVLTGFFAGIVAAADAPAASSGADLEEVIVTAEKTAEEASKTPLALSVFSSEDLKDSGIYSADTLSKIAPSVNIGTALHGNVITIRGVTTTDTSSKGQMAVLFNQDGVAAGRLQITQLAFFDIDRVEVLRGPQGTLYGQTATGGAINVLSNKPKLEAFDAAASFEVGDYNTRRTEGMVNVPLTDTFAVRLAISTNQRDGFLNPTLQRAPNQTPSVTAPSNGERPLGDEDNSNGRFSALWKYSDSGNLVLRVAAGRINGTGDASARALYDRYTGTSSYSRQVYYNPMEGGVDDQYHQYFADLNQDIGPVHLEYVGGYLGFSGEDNFAPTTGWANGATPRYSWNDYYANNTYDSHELRVSNTQPQRVDYVVGANYYREQTNEIDADWSTLVFATPSIGCNYAAPNTAPYCSSPNPNILSLNQHEAKGVFGQLNWHVTDELKLTGGLRYSSDSMFRHGSIAAGSGPGPFGNFYDASGNICHPGDICVPLSNGSSGSIIQNDVGSQSGSKTTYRVAADWQFTPNQMLYAYTATGYKAGSFNDICPNANPAIQPAPCSYGPESMTAYEMGYKGKVLPNLEIDTDVYYYDYKNFQQTQGTFLATAPNGAGQTNIIYTILVPLEMYGWEGELHWNLTQDDLFNVTATVENAFYRGGANHATVGNTPFLRTLPQGNWSDKRMDNLPPFSSTVSYEHRFRMGDGGYFSGRVSSKISGGYYESDLSGISNDGPGATAWLVPPTQYYQKSYTKTDLDFSYTNASGKFSMDAFVRNVENKMQMVSTPAGLINPTAAAGTANPDQTTVAVTIPRTLGLRVNLKL